MKKLICLLILISLVLTVGCGDKDKKDSKMSDAKESAVALVEGPLTFPEGSNAEANGHNEEGISHYKEGHMTLLSNIFEQHQRLTLLWERFISTRLFH